jgi:nitroreductase
MELISVDRTKCKRDGICIAECPFQPHRRKRGRRLPHGPAGGGQDLHRLRPLPGGLPPRRPELQGPRAGQLPADRPQADPAPEAIAQFLRSRRSIRTYKDKPVPREVLEELLDISRWAPSAKNAQPTKWLVIESAAEIKNLIDLTVEWLRKTNSFPGVVGAWEQEGRDLVLRSAPHLVIAYASEKALKPEIDCTIALTYLDLAAHGQGLGTCWAGIFLGAAFNHPPLIEALNLPENHRSTAP